MDTPTAKFYLNQLVNGINPATTQPFPADSIYNHPTIIRALAHIQLLLNTPVAPAPPAQAPKPPELENQGKRWTPEDDQQLAYMFSEGVSVEDLAAQFKRGNKGIVARLVDIGAIPTTSDLLTRYQVTMRQQGAPGAPPTTGGYQQGNRQPQAGLENQGARWTPEDDAQLTQLFGTQTPVETLATHFRRTPKGIVSRLVGKNLIAADSDLAKRYNVTLR